MKKRCNRELAIRVIVIKDDSILCLLIHTRDETQISIPIAFST